MSKKEAPKTNGKLVPSYDKLIEIIGAQKILGKIIIFLSGTWDLIHIGHCRYFLSAIEEVMRITARSREDIILVVGVDNDEEVKARKGKFRPIVPESERAEMLEYLESVNYVIIKTEAEQSWNLAELIKPNYVVISKTTKVVGEERDTMIEKIRQFADDVVLLPPQAETSTTGKIRLLLIEPLDDVRKEFDTFVTGFYSVLDRISGSGGDRL